MKLLIAIAIAGFLSVFFLASRLAHADNVFKQSHPISRSFDDVWEAVASVLSEEEIAQADKSFGQIVTAPKTHMDILRGGNVTTQIVVKISKTNPCIVKVMVKNSTQYHGVQVRRIVMAGEVKEEVDEGKSQELIEKIEGAL